MYIVDDLDRVQELTDLPQSSGGAPLPVVVAVERALAVAYIVEDRDPNWDGRSVRVINAQTPGEHVAIVEFQRPLAHQFGPPNDEAFHGHPLADRGLHPYAGFEVLSSSWIRALERMNRVHSRHRPQHYAGFRHFVLAFHDSTFECVAEGYRVVGVREGSLSAVAPELLRSVGLSGQAG